MRRFTVHIDGVFDLSEDEIWPDHDAPEAPSVIDVAAVIRESTFDVQRLISDWNLLPAVTVTGAGESVQVSWR